MIPSLGFVTTTLASVPAGRAGVLAEIWVGEVTKTSVAGWPPTVTVAPSSKSVPKIEKSVPPAGGPKTGEMEKMMRGDSSEVCPFGSVAVTVTGWPTSIVKARSALNSRVSGAVRDDVHRSEVQQPLGEILGTALAGRVGVEVQDVVRRGALSSVPWTCVPDGRLAAPPRGRSDSSAGCSGLRRRPERRSPSRRRRRGRFRCRRWSRSSSRGSGCR